MAALERHVGERLLERDNTHVEPTLAGKVFLRGGAPGFHKLFYRAEFAMFFPVF